MGGCFVPLVLAACAAFCQAALTIEGTLGEWDFNEFMKANGRNYKTASEYERRKEIFESNSKMVEWLNSRNDDDAVYEINHMADLEPKDFLMSLHTDDPQFDEKEYLPLLPTSGLPESFDWREKGAVSEVRNQGSIGSCWAFSAAANIEGQMFLKTKKLVALSTEQLVECDRSNCGAFGGWPHWAYQTVKETGGLVSWDEMPYCAGDGSCSPCMPHRYNRTMCGDHSDLYCNRTQNVCKKLKREDVSGTVSGWGVVHKDEEQIKAALVKYGPLSVGLDATLLQFYSRGIWNPFLCTRTLNHALLIVGYGVEQGKPYWTVKNSWGVNWGDNGYFKMIRGKDKCGFTVAVTTAFTD